MSKIVYKILNFITTLLLLLFFISTPGCVVVADYMIIAGSGEKDLSHDFSRGHVIGKEYETLKDMYLTQFYDSSSLNIETSPARKENFNKGHIEISYDIYSKIEIISKGTKLRICKVLARTSFGSEKNRQEILANLVDTNGNIVPVTNSEGKRSLIKVSCLFENTNEQPFENWLFRPECDLIKEINRG